MRYNQQPEAAEGGKRRRDFLKSLLFLTLGGSAVLSACSAESGSSPSSRTATAPMPETSPSLSPEQARQALNAQAQAAVANLAARISAEVVQERHGNNVPRNMDDIETFSILATANFPNHSRGVYGFGMKATFDRNSRPIPGSITELRIGALVQDDATAVVVPVWAVEFTRAENGDWTIALGERQVDGTVQSRTLLIHPGNLDSARLQVITDQANGILDRSLKSNPDRIGNFPPLP